MQRFQINYLFLIICKNVMIIPIILIAAIFSFPFFFIQLSFKYGLVKTTISFIDEIICTFIEQLKWHVATYMVCSGLILHKTYLNYVVKKLKFVKIGFINFVEMLEDLNAN